MVPVAVQTGIHLRFPALRSRAPGTPNSRQTRLWKRAFGVVAVTDPARGGFHSAQAPRRGMGRRTSVNGLEAL